MWETKEIPLDEKAFIWIKSKVGNIKRGQIIIEIQNQKAVKLHYICSEYFVDVDKGNQK